MKLLCGVFIIFLCFSLSGAVSPDTYCNFCGKLNKEPGFYCIYCGFKLDVAAVTERPTVRVPVRPQAPKPLPAPAPKTPPAPVPAPAPAETTVHAVPAAQEAPARPVPVQEVAKTKPSPVTAPIEPAVAETQAPFKDVPLRDMTTGDLRQFLKVLMQDYRDLMSSDRKNEALIIRQQEDLKRRIALIQSQLESNEVEKAAKKKTPGVVFGVIGVFIVILIIAL